MAEAKTKKATGTAARRTRRQTVVKQTLAPGPGFRAYDAERAARILAARPTNEEVEWLVFSCGWKQDD